MTRPPRPRVTVRERSREAREHAVQLGDGANSWAFESGGEARHFAVVLKGVLRRVVDRALAGLLDLPTDDILARLRAARRRVDRDR